MSSKIMETNHMVSRGGNPGIVTFDTRLKQTSLWNRGGDEEDGGKERKRFLLLLHDPPGKEVGEGGRRRRERGV